MYDGNNPTALKSKQWITDALLSMMEEKSYTGISVKDICTRADLSRQTFYNLFESKDDVLHAYLREEVAKAYENMAQAGENASLSLEDMVEPFVKVLEDNRQVLTLMINQGLENIIDEEISDAVSLFARHFAKDSSASELAYSAAFLSGGLAKIMLFRFKQEKPLELGEFKRLLKEIFVGNIYRI